MPSQRKAPAKKNGADADQEQKQETEGRSSFGEEIWFEADRFFRQSLYPLPDRCALFVNRTNEATETHALLADVRKQGSNQCQYDHIERRG